MDSQLSEWATVPDYARWWTEEADPSQREAFYLEWKGITEARLRDLEQWAAEGRLTPVQRARYDELQALIARHRPTIEQLLAE